MILDQEKEYANTGQLGEKAANIKYRSTARKHGFPRILEQ